MADNTQDISSFVNRAGLTSDKEFFVGVLKEINDAYDKLNAKKISINNAAGTGATIAAVKDASKAEQEYQRILAQSTQLIAKHNGSSGELLKNAKLIAQAELNTAKAQKEAAAASLQQAKAQDVQAKSAATLAKERDKAEKARQKDEKSLHDLSNEYGILSKATIEAQLRAKNYTLTLGENHPITQQAVKDAVELSDKLKKIDASVGQYQRNVGNYASGFNGLRNSINQLTREAPAFAVSVQTGILALSNNLPVFFDEISKAKQEIRALRAEGKETQGMLSRLGSAFFSFGTFLSIGVTLLTLYGKEIGNFVAALFKGREALDAFAERQKALNEAFKDNGLKNAIVEVEKVGIAFQLAREGTISHEKALKTYNETLGDTFGKATSLNEAERLYNANSDNFIKATLFRAAAMKALEKASDAALRAMEAQLKGPEQFSSGSDFFGSLSGYGGKAGIDQKAIDEQAEKTKKARERRQKEEVDAANKQSETLKEVAKGLFAKAADYAKDLPKFDLFGTGNDAEKKVKDVERDYRAIFDTLKKDIERQIALQEELSQNELLSLNQRLEAQRTAFALRSQLIKAEHTFELNDTIANQRKQLKEENLTAEAKVNIRKNTADKIREINQDAASAEQDAEFDNTKKLLAILADYRGKREQLLKADLDLAKDLPKKTAIEELVSREDKAFEKRVNNLKENNDYLVASLEREKNLKLGAAKTEEQRQQIEEKYQKKRLAVELETDRLILLAALDLAKAKIKLITDPTQKAAIEAQIASISKQLAELGNKKFKLDIDVDREKLQALEKTLQTIAVGITKTFDVIGGLIGANIDRQKNAIQDIIDKNAERTRLEIEGVNASTLSQEEKANRIAIINARAAAEKEKLELKQRQLDLQRARFEKAATIARIVVESALAVVHQLGSGDPYTAIPRAIAAGVLGAAQLAVAIATPLPKFFKGKERDELYEGWGIVGDGGRKELHIRESGQIEITPDKPTKTWIGKRDVILPDADAIINMALYGSMNQMQSATMPIKSNDYQELESKVDKLAVVMEKINRTIENKPVHRVVNTYKGVHSSYEAARKHWEYIKDQTGL